MQVLLLEDIYKLGRAGQVKKVADGFGRNYLIPQGLATRATKGALQQADRIAAEADKKRTALNAEMSAVAEKFTGLQLMCMMHAGFKKIDPGLDTGMAFDDEYQQALALFNPG